MLLPESKWQAADPRKRVAQLNRTMWWPAKSSQLTEKPTCWCLLPLAQPGTPLSEEWRTFNSSFCYLHFLSSVPILHGSQVPSLAPPWYPRALISIFVLSTHLPSFYPGPEWQLHSLSQDPDGCSSHAVVSISKCLSIFFKRGLWYHYRREK